MGDSIKGFEVNSNGQSTIKKYDYNSLDNIPVPDTTLTQAGAAADSKTTGDNIFNLKAGISYNYMTNIPSYFINCDDININSLYFISRGGSSPGRLLDWPLNTNPGWLFTFITAEQRLQIAIPWKQIKHDSDSKIKYRTRQHSIWSIWEDFSG